MAEEKVAEEIFKEFKEHSVAEFFRKNRQMLGFSGKVRSLTTIVHEYVTNSLDACEEAGILPNITVKIEVLPDEHIRVTAEDNGPGIPKEHIGNALGMMLSGTKFHRYMQQRGQQGIGASGCTMFAQMTTGKPVHVKSGTGSGTVYECDLSVDVKTNSPNISNLTESQDDFRGVSVSAEFAEVKYDKGEHSALEYLKRTAMANPHAQITFIDPDGDRFVFPRAVEEVPERPREVQPHPLGVTTNDLMDWASHAEQRKLSSFLNQTFTRMSSAKVDELRSLLPQINFDKNPRELRWAEAEAIVKAFQSMRWIAPATDSVRPIGQAQIEKALKNVLNPEFLSVRERRPSVYRGGVPFVIETAIAYGGKAGRPSAAGAVGLDILRFANRAPLLFDGGGCAITEAVKSIDWKRYDVKDLENTPISVFVNIASVFVPYTGAGKQAVASEEEIITEIRYGIMEVARDLQRYLSGKIRESDREAKRKAIMRYVKQLSRDLPELAAAGKSEEIEKKLVELVQSKYAKALEVEEGKEEKGGEEEKEEDIEKEIEEEEGEKKEE
ncbi:MAG: DNA topoisomerase VI subunit B [Candidatus Micrarchaeia archaeon]